ncbi:hypothetical protein A2U01_0103450, partial [Trifolium medium]|nr:hypothetical protein [Trifolium medium]
MSRKQMIADLKVVSTAL